MPVASFALYKKEQLSPKNLFFHLLHYILLMSWIRTYTKSTCTTKFKREDM